MIPLRLGSPASFAAVRDYLNEAGYTEAALLERFQIPKLHDLLFPYGLTRESLHQRYQGPDLVLARLLMGGYTMPREEAGSSIPPEVLAAFEELGIVEPVEGGLRAPVILYPALGFFLAADRPMYSDGSRAYQGTDYVMSGAEVLCRTYVAAIPTTPCSTFLDMGCGSGLAALTASRVAGHVWATDITERAIEFAEFNRRLNGVENMTVLCGDLFAPLEGRRFERIASNPPFEPPLKQNLIFSVGGEDGEAILERLVREAPAHLEPGGRLYCLVSGTDRLNEPFDMRVRRWLGERAKECDVALFVREKLTPREYAIEQILSDNADSWKIEEWSRFYQKLQAVRVLVGFLVIQRVEGQRPVFHTRQDLAEGTGIAEMDWLLDWETQCVSPGIVDFMLQARPVAVDGWQLHVHHGFADGELSVDEMVLKQARPFVVDLECSDSLPRLICRCDGTRTGAELFGWLREHGAVKGEEALPGFVRGLCALVSNGFLRVSGSADAT